MTNCVHSICKYFLFIYIYSDGDGVIWMKQAQKNMIVNITNMTLLIITQEKCR